jgi:hypothetical protein
MKMDSEGRQEKQKTRVFSHSTSHPLILNIITLLKLIKDLCLRSAALLLKGVCFYLLVTPLGWILRNVGVELMSQQINPSCKTYWLTKEDMEDPRSSMYKQW